jgi:hypothetical protein
VIPLASEIATARAAMERRRRAALDLAELRTLRLMGHQDAIAAIAARWDTAPDALPHALEALAAGLEDAARDLHELRHRQRDALEDPRYDEVRQEVDALGARQVELAQAVMRGKRLTSVLAPVIEQVRRAADAYAGEPADPVAVQVRAAHVAALRAGIRGSTAAIGLDLDGPRDAAELPGLLARLESERDRAAAALGRDEPELARVGAKLTEILG